eukprot:scaffold25174_cov175-Skeletonema_marinoi.AAC.2
MPTLTWAVLMVESKEQEVRGEEWMSQNRSGTQRGLINVRSVTSQSGVQITGTQAGVHFRSDGRLSSFSALSRHHRFRK